MGERDVRVDIIGARIDEGALIERPAAEEIRRAPAVEVVERAENHDQLQGMEFTNVLSVLEYDYGRRWI